ncbi:HpcH/HpaI aldolase/citrate lyase family protein [Aeromicrobium sp. CF4.19]|uniref:HpcH/HpaI aldolase/citrate lyase family protein n=1 Tax=Aeromicrobium sp. CF4.19 TaxID=3373082 RepID=UPI003EE4FA8F
MNADVLPRSYLYVPGVSPERMPKAYASEADAVIVDLEDAVPLDAKEQARRWTTEWIASLPRVRDTEVWVRINPGPLGEEDLAALVELGDLDGIMLAKADAAGLTRARGILTGSGHDWALSPLVETPGALFDVRALAAVDGVSRLQLGEYDLCAELGVQPGQDERETDWPRAMLVAASVEARIDPPVAPVSVVIKDVEALATSTLRARRQGFVGRACIHPAQISAVHEVFTPTDREVEDAEAMIGLFEQAAVQGSEVVVDAQGRMVDRATVRSARRTLAMSRSATAISE